MALILTLTDGEGVSGLQAVFGAFINTNLAQTAADAAAAAMSASAAAASASASATSATASAASAAAALASQNAAASSASASATSATASAASASAAAGSATNAGNSATAASNSASAAAGSATSSGTSATNAANSAAAAAATLANALTKANNLSDVASATVALLNLGGAPIANPSFTTSSTLTGNYTGAITAAGALSKDLSKSGVTGQQIYGGIFTGGTSFDVHQATLTLGAGTTVTTNAAFGGYINNQNGTGTPNSGNSVNFFGVTTAAVANAGAWGLNCVLCDNTSYSPSTVTGVQLNGAEYDFDVTSPHTNVQGPTLTGSSLVQPSAAVGFNIGSLSVQDVTIAKWTYGFVTQDGVASVAAHWGAAAASGTSIGSQPTTYNYFDSTSTIRAWSQQVGGNGNMTFSDSGSGHQVQISAPLLSKVLSGTGSISVDTSTPSQQSVVLFDDNGTNKYQIGKGTSNDFFAYDTAAGRFIWDMPTGGALTFTPNVAFSGTLTPSQTNGIVGTTTNNNANAGSVGEYLSSSVTAVSMTSGAASNLTTLPLTPGDWDVVGNVGFVPNSTTVATSWFCGISTTSGSFGPVGGGTRSGSQVSAGQTSTIMEYLTPPVRISVSANTTVYLLAQTGFTVSTMTCNGFLRARRVR